ncbi:Hypothetical_protein [Hexamita inflata]|uniref:Hypothetical_protein n=1 Tax=Hexamita inflata TaxID=28002 RepID=A0AA86Q5F8_9EUKA|nr:Hypothetical protein HINF_LOCUS40131 [Hexamita inflata]
MLYLNKSRLKSESPNEIQISKFQILHEFYPKVDFNQDEYNIQQLYLFVNNDRSEEVVTVTAGSKQDIILIFQKLKPVGGKTELSEDKSQYVGIYSHNNFDSQRRKVSIKLYFSVQRVKEL